MCLINTSKHALQLSYAFLRVSARIVKVETPRELCLIGCRAVAIQVLLQSLYIGYVVQDQLLPVSRPCLVSRPDSGVCGLAHCQYPKSLRVSHKTPIGESKLALVTFEMSFPFHTHVLIRIHVGSTIESCLACDVDAPALEGERLGSFGDNPGAFCSFTNSSALSHLILLGLCPQRVIVSRNCEKEHL